ncbi:uncharacterized protein [Littorina saxatilis]|uniref:uncharacterized protein n=1 Tax=Littorina saxatilis TaxID=31220 RepID=UPI0038B6946F
MSTMARQVIHTAKWEYLQFRQLRMNLPPGWILTVQDFAENYRCEYQGEVQAAHWKYDQATIFPTVTYFRCACGEVAKETVIILSPDLTHDASAVYTFTKAVILHLQHHRGLNIQHQVQFTDGCAAQFKSKEPFMDLSMSMQDFGFPIETAFFGSYHGKGPCDGAGGMAKSAARRAVLGEQVCNVARPYKRSSCKD